MREIRDVLQLKCEFGWSHREGHRVTTLQSKRENFHFTSPVLGCKAMP